MHVFIVRPFGTKQGIDFNRVEAELIQPALAAVDIHGGTTAEIVKQGNIRHDMFQLLLTADLVVADLSIHNANAFYELGIRHALRDKRTVLIRCEGDDVPFDLLTDRYLVYDKDAPAQALGGLIATLRATIRSKDRDSPVFQLLPNLEAQDPSRFLVVPDGFREEVEIAQAAGRLGDLELLADETDGFPWELEGLRIIGRAQFDKKMWRGARATWERIRGRDPQDEEANLKLATVYQRMEELARSDQAVKRVLERPGLRAEARAEAQSLVGSNAKQRWRVEWEGADPKQWRKRALRSRHLAKAYEAYERGFLEDLNHYYSGINALGLLTVLTELATAQPETWAESFETEGDAQRELERLVDHLRSCASSVWMSLEAEQGRLERAETTDIWFDLTLADLKCYTLEQPARVARAYYDALTDAEPFHLDAARNQLQLLEKLDVRGANVKAALAELDAPRPPKEKKKRIPEQELTRVLLFTGHEIDPPDRRPPPRFPADKEALARQAIHEALVKEREDWGGELVGIAAGACGGDILFHEVCAELGIPTRLYLGLPREDYLAAAVRFAGTEWVDRFDRLYQSLESRILSEAEELPDWLVDKKGKEGYSLWQRAGLWMLHNGLALGDSYLTLIALWDGMRGEGPATLIAEAEKRGARSIVLNSDEIFGLKLPPPKVREAIERVRTSRPRRKRSVS